MCAVHSCAHRCAALLCARVPLCPCADAPSSAITVSATLRRSRPYQRAGMGSGCFGLPLPPTLPQRSNPVVARLPIGRPSYPATQREVISVWQREVAAAWAWHAAASVQPVPVPQARIVSSRPCDTAIAALRLWTSLWRPSTPTLTATPAQAVT
ncbi:hypothetical protein HBI56_069440 [Parastagonospora nodorum]|jgi:hypothetical protein|uniref:Secreted protein n=1 Tax=Phaeosphaeria nodorum (strain SN15 / ATCC MYA-4574 / FGSC 10173) TaxID=321614 RepID=A0A7U2ENY7_PHANO|nr:hypothetical protein HBH56_003880 [Parastagonospora nodorum]QRC90302.1 hypothetical protein JI435_097080 [Parastagonospora nodorum SN15]KAH3937676.1 hypothetical protein HBH54_003870 [Parastagonospora nodorum]KAH3946688.1 hypothetical protein HBH53_128110 [Parastagonospora nodorum]KAH3975069.1 hypothetical protein HBH51_086640 [Parastagonospora nodorum]